MGINSYSQADFDARMAELDRLIGPRAPVVYAPQRRAETLLDRFNPVGKIASKPNEHKAGKPIEAQALNNGSVSVCPVRHPTPPFTPSKHLSFPSHIHPSRRPLSSSLHTPVTPLKLKPWKRLAPADKLAASIVSTGHSGWAFTLNLSGSQEKALRASADRTRHISGRINRALKAVGLPSPEYAFTLEISPVGRLHVHGVVATPPGLDLDALKQALAKAGGKVKGHAGSRQVCLRRVSDNVGWSSYILKDVRRTRRALETEKLIFLSAPLRRKCTLSYR